ncbi:hypothetical protein TNCV_4505681 [Trichonephila clavipes]|nr:hypothetical protein TNCV_4505681 [Trichonephila clavipes]
MSAEVTKILVIRSSSVAAHYPYRTDFGCLHKKTLMVSNRSAEFYPSPGAVLLDSIPATRSAAGRHHLGYQAKSKKYPGTHQ